MLFYHDPVHIVRGEGVNLYDADGRRYLDCYNNVQSMGHGNARIARAIAQQSATLTTHTRYLHENVIELAEEVAATLPGDLEVCLFTCTGTEACELAMRIARVVTGHSGIVVMAGSYHGNSKLVGEMSTCVYPEEQRPPWIEAIEPPNTYRGPFRAGEGDDSSLGRRYAELVEPAIAELQRNGEGLSAFVCDSIFDSNGALNAPRDYLAELYARVRAAGGLCVADEVQAGVCRTGQHFWGFEHYDVVPDILVAGKNLSGGVEACAGVAARDDVLGDNPRATAGSTFAGTPGGCAAALKTLDIYERDNVLEHAAACYIKLPKPEDGGGSIWDFAATACIVREAGAWVSNIHGAELDLNRRDSTFMNHQGVVFASSEQLASTLIDGLSPLVKHAPG